MKERIQSWIWNFRRANRVDKAFLLSSLLLALPAFSKGFLSSNLEWLQGLPRVQAALQTGLSRAAPLALGLGALCLVYASYKIWFWRPPLPAPPPAPPDAIKGGTSFGPQDGDLFLRLGRTDELGKLCGWVRDPTIPVIAIKAESGAGKSSLVRSGLQYLLTQHPELLSPPLKEPIACAYCEMRPSNPVASLLAAAGAQWPAVFAPGTTPPATLDALLEQAAGAPRPLVLILDQFEQLAAHNEQHAPIFDFLVRLLQRPGPRTLTCVLAFREGYASEWMNFMVQRIDDARLTRPREMILERLKLDDHPGRCAADVLATLAHGARLNVSAVEKPLLAALADSRGRVLPFNLAIALQYLYGLGRETLEARDIPSAGLDGIFITHLQTSLGQVSEAERSELFAALFFGLVEDVGQEGRRVADGRTAEELAAGRSMPPAHLKYALNTLAERAVGVLERLPGDRYRLVHEHFIRALRELAGVMLADTDRARVVLRRASAAYEPAHPWNRLLRGADLRAVERHWDRLRSDVAVDGSDVLYRRSLLRRRWIRTGIAFTCVLTLGACIRVRQWAEDETWRNRLASWGLPRNLYDLQWKLDRLTISNSKMDDAGWIKAPLKELALHTPRLRALPPGNTYTALDLSGCGLTSLDGLERFPALTSLGLSRTHLTSLDGLERLPALTSLGLSDNGLTSLDGLKPLPTLTTLDLRGNELTSLAGLEKLPALTSLDLSRNRLTSLAGLEKLPALTSLDLSSTGLTSLAGLGNHPALTSLSLSYNALTSLAGLGNHPALTSLSLSYNALTSLAGLDKQPALTSLDLSGTQLTSLEGLEKLPALTSLNLSGNELALLVGLEKLPALTSLNLSNTRLTSLEGLDKLPARAALDLSDNRLTSLEGLEKLPAPTSLDLRLNRLTSLEGLEKLPALTSLDLSDNLLTSLAGVEKLPVMTTLNLGNNTLTSLAGLEKLSALTSLDLSNTRLTSLAGLEKLSALTSLNLHGNRLTSLTGLEALKSLQAVDIGDNPLATLQGLEQAAHLERLSTRPGDASAKDPKWLELTNYTAELTPWPPWIRGLTLSESGVNPRVLPRGVQQPQRLPTPGE